MKIKAGNSIDLMFAIQDAEGIAIQTLSRAVDVKFMVKINETDANASALISKSLSSGITVDFPNIGDIKVPLTAANTAIPPGNYFVALQIEWASYTQEVTLKEGTAEYTETNILSVIQDIIR